MNVQSHLMTNTCVFKENFKLITASAIDSIWRTKLSPENIRSTVQRAIYDSYKSNYVEIEELDEEQISSSWVNSEKETERMLSDDNLSSAKLFSQTKESTSELKVSQTKLDKMLLISDLTEKQSISPLNITPSMNSDLQKKFSPQNRKTNLSRLVVNSNPDTKENKDRQGLKESVIVQKKIIHTEGHVNRIQTENKPCMSNNSRYTHDFLTPQSHTRPFASKQFNDNKINQNQTKLRCLTKISNMRKSHAEKRKKQEPIRNFSKKQKTFQTYLNESFKHTSIFKKGKTNHTDEKIHKKNRIQQIRHTSAASQRKKRKYSATPKVQYEFKYKDEEKTNPFRKTSLTPNTRLFY